MRNRMGVLNYENGGEETSAIPKPRFEPRVLDARKPATSTFMSRIEGKGSEDVTLKKSTIWLMGAAVIILQLMFNYGGSMLAWARDDESQKGQINKIQSDIQQMEKNMTEMRTDFKDIRKNMDTQAIKDAEKRGYELKAAEGAHEK